MNPEISVVMSVFNGVNTVERSAMSVLSQEGVQLELIMIDDGSTDGADVIMGAIERNHGNARLISQRNQGLTRSLIQGCQAATGTYIARQDNGDVSLPSRFSRQLARFRADASVSMVSCGTQYVDEDGDALYEVMATNPNDQAGVTTLDYERVQGPPHHGSVMFSRELYNSAGGYREEFNVAQDLDLWYRLAERGKHISLPEVLYKAELQPGSISFSNRKLQQKMTRLIVELKRARIDGRSELPLLGSVKDLRERPDPKGGLAEYYYFVGSCLAKKNPKKARQCFLRALDANPMDAKAFLKLARSYVGML